MSQLTAPQPAQKPAQAQAEPAKPATAPQGSQQPKKPVQPESQQQTTPQQAEPKKQTADDILKRMAAEQKPSPIEPAQPQQEFNSDDLRAEINKIQDPNLKKAYEDVYSKMERGLNKKFMEISDLRKDYERRIQESNTWTPERLEATLRDPNFVALAQAKIQTQQQTQAPSNWDGSEEEWSQLTSSEQQRFMNLEQKVNSQQQFMTQMLRAQRDAQIKERYPEYDPKAIDQLYSDIQTGKMDDTNLLELMHKAISFERAVENAYRYGLQDRNGNVQEKINASSISSGAPNAAIHDPALERKEGEKPQSWFSRLAKARLEKAKQEGTYVASRA